MKKTPFSIQYELIIIQYVSYLFFHPPGIWYSYEECDRRPRQSRHRISRWLRLPRHSISSKLLGPRRFDQVTPMFNINCYQYMAYKSFVQRKSASEKLKELQRLSSGWENGEEAAQSRQKNRQNNEDAAGSTAVVPSDRGATRNSWINEWLIGLVFLQTLLWFVWGVDGLFSTIKRCYKLYTLLLNVATVQADIPSNDTAATTC